MFTEPMRSQLKRVPTKVSSEDVSTASARPVSFSTSSVARS
jgi:hypothetical protein